MYNILFNSFTGYWFIPNCPIQFVSDTEAIEYLKSQDEFSSPCVEKIRPFQDITDIEDYMI